MTANSFSIRQWSAIAGGVESMEQWNDWAKGRLDYSDSLPKPGLSMVPSRISRRLDTLGRCVMAVTEQCLPVLSDEPAVLASSRHGDLPFMDQLIQCVRDGEDVSPTAFAYSVHNRFSSLVSMFAGFHGINGAYSSRRDGVPLAIAESIQLLADDAVQQILLLAYEPEIPPPYDSVVGRRWKPLAAAFVIQNPSADLPVLTLNRLPGSDHRRAQDGGCMPLLRALLTNASQIDGSWQYQVEGPSK